MGHLAAGKTTIAKKLAHDLSLICFCKDDIKEILVDEIGFKDRAENLKLSKATFKIMSHIISRLDNDGILLLESNFKYHELDILKKQHADVSFISIFLTGDVDVLYKRYLERQKTRHIAHKSTGDIPFDVFRDSIFQFEQNQCVGKAYLMDTTKDVDVYDNVKDMIIKFLR